jgi:nucleoside-diphosphate-sugar epimerase
MDGPTTNLPARPAGAPAETASAETASKRPDVASARHPGIVHRDDVVLVTGSNGFLGAKVVEMLLEYGFSNIRCFVRPTSKLGRLRAIIDAYAAERRISIISGDLLSPADCEQAADKAALIFNLAAGFDKSFAGAFMNSVITTRNLLGAVRQYGCPKRFVQVSSFAVYSNFDMKRGALLDESAPLEAAYQERYDAYGFAKLKQEELVQEYCATQGIPYVILRPGTVFGPGKKDLTGRIGIDTFGIFIHVGGANPLPMTFVDNCAEALVMAALKPGLGNQVFNVVDDDVLSSAEFLRRYKRRLGRFPTVRMPYWLAYGLCALWERYSRYSSGQLPPAFNRRRCAAEWKGNRFSNRKLREAVGWRPRVGVDQAMTLFLEQFPPQAR